MHSEAPERGAARKVASKKRILLVVMLVAVLLSGLGFVYKLIQFARASVGEDISIFEFRAFALPLLAYLGMAAGFACMLGWAALRGMFHGIETPKYRLLEREEEYERLDI